MEFVYQQITFTGREAITEQGCPTAKWIITRSSPDEKYLVVFRKRSGHTCNYALIAINIVAWDGLDPSRASYTYDRLRILLSQHVKPDNRDCRSNVQ
jgi:hypothetical protein